MSRTRARALSRPGTGRTAPSAPPDVPGLRLGPPLGFGARGPVWSATAAPGGRLRPGRACAVCLLPGTGGEREERQRRRLDALVGVRHESVAEVLAILHASAGWAVVSERLDGPTLAVLRASRSALTPAEIASLLRPLAEGLAWLHGRGVTHGDVSPANVVLVAPGRPVLVDLAGEVAFEAGTRGFLAPERVLGSPAGPSADVWSLATTALWLADAAGRSRLQEALAPALVPDPAVRCSARQLAGLAAALGEPEAVMVPSASSLAQGSLRARAAIEETRLSRTRRTRPARRASGRHRRARGRLSGPALGGGPRPPANRRRSAEGGLRRPREVQGRLRGPWPRPRLSRSAGAVVGLLLAVGMGALVVAQGAAWARLSAASWRPAASPDASAEQVASRERAAPAGAPVSASDVVAATHDLFDARDDALNRGDAEALSRLVRPGSPAARGDAALVAAVAAGTTDVSGLETRVRRVGVRDVSDGTAVVEVLFGQGAYTRTGAHGPVDVPEQPARCLVLGLERVDGTWLLRDAVRCRSGTAG